MECVKRHSSHRQCLLGSPFAVSDGAAELLSNAFTLYLLMALRISGWFQEDVEIIDNKTTCQIFRSHKKYGTSICQLVRQENAFSTVVPFS